MLTVLQHELFSSDRGILMTFGSGSNGCLGHGNYHDIQHVSFAVNMLDVTFMDFVILA